jgi:hypothetical protein
MPHFFDALAQAQIDLYLGDARGAFERADDAFVELRRALLLRVQFVRVKMLELRARTALAAGRRRAFERDLAALESEDAPWAGALALHLRACDGRASFVASARVFDGVGMAGHAAVAHARSGSEKDLAHARTWFEREGIREPDRLVSMLSPTRP